MADCQLTCRACGKQFRPKRTDRATCCSRECGWVWVHFRRSAYAHSFRVFVRVARTKPKKRVWASTLPSMMDCRACGVQYLPASSGGRPSCYCSGECLASAKRKWRLPAKKKRKAIKRGANGGENVKADIVFVRDGWRCQLCGYKVRPDKRGTTHRLAPELDHIIPVSMGGLHTYANVQCACRECNARKGATAYGQLVLFPTG